jgi:endonuclease YncB( thermonuclease family)
MKKLLLILMFVPLVSFGQDFKVVRVIDGDTFIIEGGERVRMIGIDHLKALIQNKHVKLIKGVVTANKDYFKRLLRYVYIDSTDINLKMIEDGFASVYLKYPFSKSSEYKTIFDYIKTNKLR